MRLYDNPLLAITYLLGAGVKSIKDKAQHAYNKRTERKELVSAIQYLSSDEEERKQRDKIMARRQKCAAVCLISELAVILLVIVLPASYPLVIFGICVIVIATCYGLWYSLFGKYW